MAGMRTLEELLALAPDAYDITVFGAEPHGNYNRIMLSPVLAGEKAVDEIMLNDERWYAEQGIALHKGGGGDRNPARPAPGDRRGRTRGRATTGCCSPPARSRFSCRCRAAACRAWSASATSPTSRPCWRRSTARRKAVVIGGGLLGLEAANGLLRQGMDVTVVHLLRDA